MSVHIHVMFIHNRFMHTTEEPKAEGGDEVTVEVEVSEPPKEEPKPEEPPTEEPKPEEPPTEEPKPEETTTEEPKTEEPPTEEQKSEEPPAEESETPATEGMICTCIIFPV